MTHDIENLASFFKTVATTLDDARAHPHGPAGTSNERTAAGEACVRLCGGDNDKARTLWKIIQADLGYMPHAALRALVFAANTHNLVPDIEPPEVN